MICLLFFAKIGLMVLKKEVLLMSTDCCPDMTEMLLK